jgi:hypothetical protein
VVHEFLDRHRACDGSRSIELRAEFVNLLNHLNFANPISDLGAVDSTGSLDAFTGHVVRPGDFGRIISTISNPRLIGAVELLSSSLQPRWASARITSCSRR